MLTVTANAIDQIKTLLTEQNEPAGAALRIHVDKGGCSGMQYNMSFDTVKPDDTVIEEGGVRVVVDKNSESYLRESVVDYVDSLSDRGFKITNPNAKRSCGCGKSFEV